jgi:TetR/AcrR family transcriptional regulator, cholesterol catabolism regulator
LTLKTIPKKNYKNFEPFNSFHSFLAMEIKERILNAAESLFLRLGVKSVTMDDIAHELGISKKTIYLHFSDKNEIVNAVVEYTLKREKKESERIYSLSENPIDEIVISTQMMCKMFENINPVLFYDLKKYHPEAWGRYVNFKSEFLEIVIRNLKEGIERGYYRHDIDPDILAKLRVESVDLAFNMDLFPPSIYNTLKIQVTFVDHFLRGILTSKGLEIYEKTKHTF